jgi:hypothetical protein
MADTEKLVGALRAGIAGAILTMIGIQVEAA